MSKDAKYFGIVGGGPFADAFFARAIAQPPRAWRSLAHRVVYQLLFWESHRIPPSYLREMNCQTINDMEWYEILRMNPMMMKHPLCPSDWSEECWEELTSINPGCAKYRQDADSSDDDPESDKTDVSDAMLTVTGMDFSRCYPRVVVSLQRLGLISDDVPREYDGYLQLSSMRTWEDVCKIVNRALMPFEVECFMNVKLNGGYADTAFSTATKAFLVQAYRGRDKLSDQCKELATVAKTLTDNEPDGQALSAIFFAEAAGIPSLPAGITSLTPGDIGKIKRWFRPMASKRN